MPNIDTPSGSVAKKKHSRLAAGDWSFVVFLVVVCGGYLLLLLAILVADAVYLSSGDAASEATEVSNPFTQALSNPDIRYSIRLTLVSCTITAVLSIIVAVPIGYLLSRFQFRGKQLVDSLFDIPIVLPPLAVGLSLLILFQYLPQSLRDSVVYQIPAVILAQFIVASAFAIRTMRATFDQIDHRREQVALTLGCSKQQAFAWVVLPEAGPGVLTAATLAWARALGEFGPLLVFAGATRGKTEVLSTTVFLELSVGNLRGAVAVSMLMIAASLVVLTVTRILCGRRLTL